MIAGWHRSPLTGFCAVAGRTLLARVLWARRVAQARSGDPRGVRTDDGVLLHTELEGRADARLTVVLVHGFAARLDEFDAQRSTLRARTRVVLYDQRGHGRSGWRGPRSATIERLAQDLAGVLDAVPQGDRVILVGHSMGGMAVLALARQRPDLIADRVGAVALLSTSAGHLAQSALPPALARAMVRSGIAAAVLWLLWALAPLIDLVAPLRTRLGRRWLRRRLFGRAAAPDDAVAKVARIGPARRRAWRPRSTPRSSLTTPPTPWRCCAACRFSSWREPTMRRSPPATPNASGADSAPTRGSSRSREPGTWST